MRTANLYVSSIIIALSGLLMWGATMPVRAAPICLPVEKLTEIATQLKMVVIWKGQGRQGETYAIYANKDGVWDAVLIYPDMSKACIVAEGSGSKLQSLGM